MKLSGRTAIVTGGHLGLGLEVAKAYLRTGANVAICCRLSSRIEALEEELKEFGESVLIGACDISSFLEAANFVKKVKMQYGHIDILVNNASYYGEKLSIVDCPPEHFKEVIHNNVLGNFNMTHAALPHMIEQKHGKIISLTAEISHRIAGDAFYVSKAAQQALNTVISSDYNESNIFANMIDPSGFLFNKNSPFYEHIEQQDEQLAIEKLYRLFIYLASSDSNGVNGKIIKASEWIDPA